MSNFEEIISTEKQRQYQLPEQDQFVYETLSKVQEDRSDFSQKALLLFLVSLVSIALVVQLLFLQSASFENLITLIKDAMSTKPYTLAFFNLGVVALIIFLRRSRTI